MIKLIISTLFSSLLLSCIANTTHKSIKKLDKQNDQSEIKQKAEQLEKAYKQLSAASYTTKCQKEYFDSFPSSFVLLNSLFGYTDKEPMGKEFKPGPLYNEANLHIEAFFKLNEIEKMKYYDRIIDISINGRWYADGVSYFQSGMENKVKADLTLFSKLLSKHSDNEIKSFWYFYFDGPHPTKELPQELQKVKEINSRIFSLMKLALKEVQQAWKE